jgi:hypothetical protein
MPAFLAMLFDHAVDGPLGQVAAFAVGEDGIVAARRAKRSRWQHDTPPDPHLRITAGTHGTDVVPSPYWAASVPAEADAETKRG